MLITHAKIDAFGCAQVCGEAPDEEVVFRRHGTLNAASRGEGRILEHAGLPPRRAREMRRSPLCAAIRRGPVSGLLRQGAEIGALTSVNPLREHCRCHSVLSTQHKNLLTSHANENRFIVSGRVAHILR